ncbi:hypothetical protein V3565_00005 [Bartonella sp. B10]
MIRSVICGVGSALPKKSLSNDEVAKFVVQNKTMQSEKIILSTFFDEAGHKFLYTSVFYKS